ncbi:MAG: imidazole glycerol phosphate synthase subunit HisH [Oceanospirillaceae bacterium]|nr:imidazole glycerol phosphate synthase subunit HisH [Oceanospirillaceae bacterium]
MNRIAVIDYGMGNLHSVAKALELVSTDSEVVLTADPQVVRDADRVLLPGVGAIRDCMAEMRRLGVDAEVREAIQSGKPFLGICVGYQALTDFSEENGGVECLSEFGGRVNFFGKSLKDAAGEKLKVPHMGWNQVHQTVDHPLWHNIEQDTRFYFVHSYHVHLADKELVAGTCEYGVPFDVALAKDNVFAVQFHPEKSSKAGLQLLQNFVNWNGAR